MKIESRIGKSSCEEKDIYLFVSDFNNFKKLIPSDRVRNWESSSDRCSFEIQPLGRTGLRIVEKEPFKLVKMTSDPDYSKYNLTLWVQIRAAGPGDTRIRLTAEPHINQMMLSMIKGTVKIFLDRIVDKIEEIDFSQRSKTM
ncbi:MAG: hypothetical protein ACOYXB_06795 [Bacteroidota bacterium]